MNNPSIDHYIIKLHVFNMTFSFPCMLLLMFLLVNNDKLFITHVFIVPLFNFVGVNYLR